MNWRRFRASLLHAMISLDPFYVCVYEMYMELYRRYSTSLERVTLLWNGESVINPRLDCDHHKQCRVGAVYLLPIVPTYIFCLVFVLSIDDDK